MVLKKTLESPLDSKEIKPVNPKGNQLWLFTGRTDAEAPILWPPDVKGQLIGKDPDAEKDWGQEEKGTTEGEMVGWHHRFSGHEFEQTPGDGEEQGSVTFCSPWGHRESVTASWLNTNYRGTCKSPFSLCSVIGYSLQLCPPLGSNRHYLAKCCKSVQTKSSLEGRSSIR